MLKATAIEYFVNREHYNSGLPPVATEPVSLEAPDYIALNDIADKHRAAFRSKFGLPGAVGVMKLERDGIR